MRIFENVKIIIIFNFGVIFELIVLRSLLVHKVNFETFGNNSVSPFLATALLLLKLSLFLKFYNLVWYQFFIQIAALRKFEVLIHMLILFGFYIVLLLNLMIHIFTLSDAFIWFHIIIIYFLDIAVLPACSAFETILKFDFQKVYLFLYFIILIFYFLLFFQFFFVHY